MHWGEHLIEERQLSHVKVTVGKKRAGALA